MSKLVEKLIYVRTVRKKVVNNKVYGYIELTVPSELIGRQVLIIIEPSTVRINLGRG